MPRYRRENLCCWLVRRNLVVAALHIPLVLHDLAQAVEHAIVVVLPRNLAAGLELTVACVESIVLVTFTHPPMGSVALAYTLVLTTSKGYLQVARLIQVQFPRSFSVYR